MLVAVLAANKLVNLAANAQMRYACGELVGENRESDADVVLSVKLKIGRKDGGVCRRQVASGEV